MFLVNLRGHYLNAAADFIWGRTLISYNISIFINLLTLFVMCTVNDFFRIPPVWFRNYFSLHNAERFRFPYGKIRVCSVSIWYSISPVFSAPWPLVSENSAITFRNSRARGGGAETKMLFFFALKIAFLGPKFPKNFRGGQFALF